MNPNKPQYLWQNNRSSLHKRYQISSRSNSLSIKSNREHYSSSFENDLRKSLLAQSQLEYQGKLQQVMDTQNELLRHQLLEIQNRQLKFQNEVLQQQVEKIQHDVENTFKLVTKQKLPALNGQYQNQIAQQIINNESIISQIKQHHLIAETNKFRNYLKENQLESMERIEKIERMEKMEKQSENTIKVIPQSTIRDNSNDYEFKIKKITIPQKPKKYVTRLKVIFLVVLAYVRWSKEFRVKRIEQAKKLKQIREKFQFTKQKILLINEDQIKLQLYQWVENVFDEFIYELCRPEFLKHCQTKDYDPSSHDNIIYRQGLILKLTLDYFIRLEKMTQMNVLPKLIVNLMYLSLFLSQNSKAPLFVAKRTNFYLKNSIKISSPQEKMIIGEYLLFRLIIQNMLIIFNNIKYHNRIHEKLTKFFVTIIASFIQILYMDYFEDIKLVKQINVELYQRKIVLDENLKALMILEEQIDENELLILGLQDRSQFEILFQQQMDWIQNISKIFHKIIMNIHEQI
ncbi:unnamed protein product (macronuclear) [Paramecium tetraurelia]|uniref:Transmembrane protein n=1 Tax=Paramecium tetraurelia TaxID=5888 RepID=A0BV28_PARTE|nr:uncharacterized protein GSPATT00005641001 [Paramecium tetraurelia]CAK62395.1 unnamed protein product [Paramecium tetraurelia]|eukprot:XP_001429793.1 hypothetical protein (macronuclear) [Paramecium tetraurelia strain d4-2]